MTTEKRKRGRPQGTGIKDMPLLREIARLKVAEPQLGVGTAHKRLRRRPSEAEIRRIQIKFREHGPALLAEARARPAPVARTSRAYSSGMRTFDYVDAYVRSVRQFEEVLGIGTFHRAVKDITDNPVLRAQRELHDKVQSIMLAVESPTDRYLRDNPYERMMRSISGMRGLR